MGNHNGALHAHHTPFRIIPPNLPCVLAVRMPIILSARRPGWPPVNAR